MKPLWLTRGANLSARVTEAATTRRRFLESEEVVTISREYIKLRILPFLRHFRLIVLPLSSLFLPSRFSLTLFNRRLRGATTRASLDALQIAFIFINGGFRVGTSELDAGNWRLASIIIILFALSSDRYPSFPIFYVRITRYPSVYFFGTFYAISGIACRLYRRQFHWKLMFQGEIILVLVCFQLFNAFFFLLKEARELSFRRMLYEIVKIFVCFEIHWSASFKFLVSREIRTNVSREIRTIEKDIVEIMDVTSVVNETCNARIESQQRETEKRNIRRAN